MAPHPTDSFDGSVTGAAGPSIDDSTRWALAARAGDATAAAAFVRATQAAVWRFVAAMVDARVADDLTQEAYLRAFRALPAFVGRSSARTWLFAIARRVCADHLRATVRQRRLAARRVALDLTETAPEAPVESWASTTELLATLAAPRREAFVLTQLLGFSYAEAAATLEVPIGTIRSRVARARTELLAQFIAADC